MKKYNTIKNRLKKELGERCYQIGIPSIEEPKICWNREQFKWYTGRKHNHKRNLGRADFKTNTILIDLEHHNYYDKPLTEIRDTMIHELVHLRWQKQRHGYHFTELIKRILKGERFPMRTKDDMWNIS